MKSVKVLYVSYDGILDPLGRSQIFPYIKQLSSRGVRYHLLTFEKKAALANAESVSRLKKNMSELGIEWRPLRYHSRPLFFAKAIDILKMVWVSLHIVKKEDIRIIHARSYIAGLSAVIVKKIYKAAFLFDMRGFWIEERVDAGMWRGHNLFYNVAKEIEKLLFKSADHVISLTKRAADKIMAIHYLSGRKDYISIIPTCVDLGLFTLSDPAKANMNKEVQNLPTVFNLVYSGSVSTWSMPIQMLRFFTTLQEIIPQAHFLVLTPEKEFFDYIMKAENCHQGAIHVFSAQYEALVHYLSFAKVGLAFYKKGASHVARCPTKIGEYLACGLPVIINAGVGDTEELIKRERIGLILKDFSQPEYTRICHELKLLLSELDIRQRCRKVAEKYFSLKHGSDSYLSVYRRLM